MNDRPTNASGRVPHSDNKKNSKDSRFTCITMVNKQPQKFFSPIKYPTHLKNDGRLEQCIKQQCFQKTWIQCGIIVTWIRTLIYHKRMCIDIAMGWIQYLEWIYQSLTCRFISSKLFRRLVKRVYHMPLRKIICILPTFSHRSLNCYYYEIIVVYIIIKITFHMW